MKRRFKLIAWATCISFFGSLPLGTLNLSVAAFAFRRDLPGAVVFSIGALLVEMTLVSVALVLIKRLERWKRYFRLCSLLTCLVLLILSFHTLIAAYEMRRFGAAMPIAGLNPLYSGLLLSIINPFHLPFWAGWIALLRSRGILDDCPGAYRHFVGAIGIGTMLAFLVYGLGGRYLIDLLGQKQILLNWIIGITLLVTALMQLYRSFFRQRQQQKR